MTVHRRQMTFEETNAEYKAFLEKFERKKTTDDCYTPENIFQCVAEWAAKRCGFSLSSIVRPFWPGGDYQAFDYPDGCVVLDNPPFSILSKIIGFYLDNGIRFFLFCPGLMLSLARKRTESLTFIVSRVSITYENGARVNTGFVTNLIPEVIAENAPELTSAIEEINERNSKEKTKQIKKVSLPCEILTAARLGWMGGHGEKFSIPRKSARFVTQCNGYSIFGGALLLSRELAAERAAAERAAAERAAAERAAAERIELGEDELRILEELGDD